jgi:hypothetical protein
VVRATHQPLTSPQRADSLRTFYGLARIHTSPVTRPRRRYPSKSTTWRCGSNPFISTSRRGSTRNRCPSRMTTRVLRRQLLRSGTNSTSSGAICPPLVTTRSKDCQSLHDVRFVDEEGNLGRGGDVSRAAAALSSESPARGGAVEQRTSGRGRELRVNGGEVVPGASSPASWRSRGWHRTSTSA